MTAPELFYGIRVPADTTLKRYGLDLEEWKAHILIDVWALDLLWHCPICKRVPPSGRTVIDHYHVKGWKGMPPEDRKKYYRGIVCVTCNHFVLTRYLTPDRAVAAAEYLSTRDVRWK